MQEATRKRESAYLRCERFWNAFKLNMVAHTNNGCMHILKNTKKNTCRRCEVRSFFHNNGAARSNPFFSSRVAIPFPLGMAVLMS